MSTAPVRVMSFNVRLDVEEDGDDAWPRRREFVADVLGDADPDAVGLQEPLAHQLEYLAEALDYEWVGVGRADGQRGGEFSPVGYDPDRFELVEADTFWLSETPDEPGSVGWDASHPRIVTWASLRDRETGQRLLHSNTHLDHEGTRARQEGARLLVERLAEQADHDRVVVTGDFNCPPGAPPCELVTDGRPAPRLRDARRVAAAVDGPRGTFHGFDGTPGERIDYVFVDEGADVRRYATLTDHRDGRYPSDHFPVFADVVPGGDGR